MGKKFDTEPETPGEDFIIPDSIVRNQLIERIRLLENRISGMEKKISDALNDPAFKNRVDTDSESWQKTENALGRIAGTIKSLGGWPDISELRATREIRERVSEDDRGV